LAVKWILRGFANGEKTVFCGGWDIADRISYELVIRVYSRYDMVAKVRKYDQVNASSMVLHLMYPASISPQQPDLDRLEPVIHG
jgi:hypothetical protein